MKFISLAKITLIFCLSHLCTCNFVPIPESKVSTIDVVQNIFISEPQSQAEYIFYQNLQARIGDNKDGDYKLFYNVKISAQASAIDNSDEAHRTRLNASLSYSLFEVKDGSIVSKGSLNLSTAYSNASYSVADDSARLGATENLMSKLASDLVVELNSLVIEKNFGPKQK